MKELMESWKSYYNRLSEGQTLGESLIDEENFPEQQPGQGDPKHYAEMAADQEMMQAVFLDLQEGEDNENYLSMIREDRWESPNPQKFLESLNSSARQGFLTSYTVEDLAKMQLFKLPGASIGFAIKDGDDIVSVHNNEGVGGLASELITAAVRNGGKKLDHFDGFLTGLYQKNRFGKIVGTDAWNDMYAPKQWEYKPVNIFDPSTSIYARELQKYKSVEEYPDELKAKIRAYKEGKPDVVYRVLG